MTRAEFQHKWRMVLLALGTEGYAAAEKWGPLQRARYLRGGDKPGDPSLFEDVEKWLTELWADAQPPAKPDVPLPVMPPPPSRNGAPHPTRKVTP